MKIVDAKVEHKGDIPLFGTKGSLEIIEEAGRTCYRSETGEINETTAKNFIFRMWKSGHMSVIEHSSVIFSTRYTRETYNRINEILSDYESKFIKVIVSAGLIYISGNLRAWMEITGNKKPEFSNYDESIYQVFTDIKSLFFGLGLTLVNDYHIVPRGLRRKAFRLTVDRAVLAEITRHRDDISFSVESQRFVSYESGVLFIKPSWMYKYTEEYQNQKYIFEESLARAENDYGMLIKSGMNKQFARGVLPNATATIIFVSAGYSQWENVVIPLRGAKDAHPDIQFVIGKMKPYFKGVK